MYRCLLLWLTTLFVCQSFFADATTFTSCYLYRNDVSDVSFTYGYNEARLAAHAMLLLEVQTDLRSNAYSNFIQYTDPAARIEAILRDDGCNMIVSTSANMLDNVDFVDFAVRYPQVYFFQRVGFEPATSLSLPPNYASFLVLAYQAIFSAGAVAAKQSSSCVGVIYTFATQSWVPNAVLQGALWAGQTTPIFSVKTGNVSNPVDEIVITDLLLKRGCDIILSATLSTVVPQYLASLQRDQIMGIGYGQDASLTAGDAILTSVMVDFRLLFFNLTLHALNRTSMGYHMNLWRASELVLADVSPQAKSGVVDLAASTRQYISSNIVLCQPFADTDGQRHSGCINNSLLNNYPYLDQRVHDMPKWSSPSTCPAGTYVEYDTVTFEITCVTCPANTFSNQRGSMSCTACLDGLRSSPGSVDCRTPSDDDFSLLLIIPIVLSALVLIVGAGLLAFALLRTTVEPSKDSKNAPRGPRVALAMIGVDGSRSDKQWRSSLTTMCEVYDRLAAVVGPVANKHKAYSFVSVGDVVMLASSSTQTLLDVLLDVHRSAWSVAWPCTVHLKLVLHEGSPTVVEGRRGGSSSKHQDRIVYSGRDLDLLRALWRHDTTHDIILSESALECLKVPSEHRVLPLESYVSADLPLASMYAGVKVGGLDESTKVPIRRLSRSSKQNEAISNPLELRTTSRGSNSAANFGADASISSTSTSEMSEAVDDDLAQLVAPTNISKEELDALSQLGVDVLQKFLRVFSFEDQVNIVTGIAKRLHVQAPRIPAMKTSVKRSFNVLRNPLKQICNQLLLSMEGRELQSWLKAVAQYMEQRNVADSHQ